MSYDGLLALIIFVGMVGLSLVLMIIALPTRLGGGGKNWFIKLSMSAICFFVIGILGGVLIFVMDSGDFNRKMDNYGAPLGLLIAIALSVWIFVKKMPPTTNT